MTIDIEQLKADIEAGTPGPWTYRPHRYDDWGLIRGGDDYPVASASTCRASDREKDKHRTNKTDPSFNNARRIARVPDMEARILSDAARIAALEAKLKTVDRGVWRIGAPDKISGSEWFIAKDKRGRRCVFRALPGAYSYNYEDGFGTYYSDPGIVAWMQFPDSHFLPPDTETESECPYAKIKALEAKVKAADELAENAERIRQYAPAGTVECRGDKCREPWCISCNGEELAEAGFSNVVKHIAKFNDTLAAYREVSS